MENYQRHILVIILMLSSIIVLGQSNTDSTALFYTTADNENVVVKDSMRYSKKLDGFQNYQPQLNYGDFFQKQSNLGQALRMLDRTPEDFSRFIDRDIFFSEAYYPYLWRKENIKYYTSLKPITDLYYVMGANKEQYFRVLHGQPLTSNLYFSVEHKVLNSPGTYQHHLSNHESPVFNLRYHTVNNKYHVLGTYFHNKVQVDDNGGIEELSYFTDSADFDERKLIPVNLQGSRLLIKVGGVHIRQAYFPSADTTQLMDSLGLSFYHDLYYQKDSYLYTDDGNPNGFYPGMKDIGDVKDSSAVKRLVNKAGARFNYQSVSFDLSVGHKYYDIWQNQKDTSLNVIVPAANLEFSKKGWTIRFEGETSYFSERQEWKVDGLFKKNFDKYSLNLKAGFRNSIPPVFTERYTSTYYEWENQFEKTFMTFASGNFTNSFIDVSLSLYDFSDYIYFDPAGRPRQNDGSFQLMQVKASSKISWKNFTLDNTLTYQDVLGDDLLRLPEYMGRHQLFYSFDMFENALNTQVGLQMSYHSSFKGHQYIPATQAFTLQNTQSIGNYPYVDVFANFYIKRTRIFVSYNHINALLEDRSYFMMPGYPMQDEAFRFGVSWMFYD